MDKEVSVMFHDDSCGELLDLDGKCPVCGFHPDMQSTAFKRIPIDELRVMLCKGHTFLGAYRTPITRDSNLSELE